LQLKNRFGELRSFLQRGGAGAID